MKDFQNGLNNLFQGKNGPIIMGMLAITGLAIFAKLTDSQYKIEFKDGKILPTPQTPSIDENAEDESGDTENSDSEEETTEADET